MPCPRSVEWAGKTLRLWVRPGRDGPKLDLLADYRWSVGLHLVVSVEWLMLGGLSTGWILQSLAAETLDVVGSVSAIIAALVTNLFFVACLWYVLDHDWSFEPHRATRRVKLFGILLRERTYAVVDTFDRSDGLIVLCTADRRSVVVWPSGWGFEAPVRPVPPELRQLIRTHLGLP